MASNPFDPKYTIANLLSGLSPSAAPSWNTLSRGDSAFPQQNTRCQLAPWGSAAILLVFLLTRQRRQH
jgi:hypothetical protein